MKNKIFKRYFNRGAGSFSPAMGMFAFFLIISLTIMLPANSEAKDWPIKPITIIVPWSAGASTDLTARTLAPKMSKILGVPVSAVNKPGGSGIIGTLEAVKSPPDGYTLFLDCGGTSSIQYAWTKDLPYKVEERTFVARLFRAPYFVIVPASTPFKTLSDLVNAIRTNPSSISYGLGGGTSVNDCLIVQFKAALMAKGVDVSKTRAISYQGTGEVIPALAGGHVTYSVSTLSASGPLITAGKIRPLAVTGNERNKYKPDVPTLTELGFPSANIEFWSCISGPPGLPANIIKTLDNALKEAIRDPEVIAKFDNILGMSPWYLSGDALRKFVFDEGDTIKALNLK